MLLEEITKTKESVSNEKIKKSTANQQEEKKKEALLETKQIHLELEKKFENTLSEKNQLYVDIKQLKKEMEALKSFSKETSLNLTEVQNEFRKKEEFRSSMKCSQTQVILQSNLKRFTT